MYKFQYDTVDLTITETDLSYHKCSREELISFGTELTTKYYVPDRHNEVFCFDKGQEIELWDEGPANYQELRIEFATCTENCLPPEKVKERFKFMVGFLTFPQ